MLSNIPIELLLEISSYLSDRDKLSFFSISRHLRSCLSFVSFKTPVSYYSIKDHKLFDCFEFVIYSSHDNPCLDNLRLPSRIKYISIPKLSLLKNLQSNTLSQISVVEIDCSTRILRRFKSLKTLQVLQSQVSRDIYLPAGLEEAHLIIHAYRRVIKLYVPESLKILRLFDCNNIDIILPDGSKSLRELYIYNYNALPELLSKAGPIEVLWTNYPVSSNVLPSSLRELYYFYSEESENLISQALEGLDRIGLVRFGYNFEEKLKVLPQTLEILEIGPRYDKDLSDLLPRLPKLKKLSLRCDITITSLPESLEELELLFLYKKEIPNLPKNLKILRLGRYYDGDLSNVPESVIVEKETSFHA
jgi:hypothetical protein